MIVMTGIWLILFMGFVVIMVRSGLRVGYWATEHQELKFPKSKEYAKRKLYEHGIYFFGSFVFVVVLLFSGLGVLIMNLIK